MSGEHRDKGAMGNYPAPAPAFLFRTEQDMAPEQSKGTDGRSSSAPAWSMHQQGYGSRSLSITTQQQPQPSFYQQHARNEEGEGEPVMCSAKWERGGRVWRRLRRRKGVGEVWESRSQTAEGFRSTSPALGAITLSAQWACERETRSAVNPGMRGNGNCA